MRIAVALALALAVQQAPPRDTPAPAPPKAGTGIIKGRVVTPEGAPVHRAEVSIGGGRGGSSVTLQTDARGRYEARDLPPGLYSVYAQPTFTQRQFLPPLPTPPMPDGSPRRVALAEGQTIEWFDIVFRRAGAIVGRVVDEFGEPVSGVSMSVQRLGDRPGSSSASSQSSDEFGRYRIFGMAPGEYELIARPFNIPSRVRGAQIGFLETYYPGTPSREDARRLTVREGRETTAADLVLATGRMLTIKGVVMDAKGNTATPATMIALGREGGGMSTSLDPQGRFSFRPEPPGRYTLTARLLSENREATLEYASVPLTLTDEDVDLVLAMKPTVTVSGRVSFDGLPPPVVTPGSLSIVVQTRQGRLGAPPQMIFNAAPVSSDMTFTVRHLAGELILRPSGSMASGWTVKSVLLGTEDITDVPREFRPEDSDRVHVVLTNRASQLTGTVSNDKGAPVRTTVVLFSEDKSLWFAHSTRVWATNPGPDGQYVLRGLRAGRYHMVALPTGVSWSRESVDTTTLEKYLPQATSVILGEDEQRHVDLKIATIPDGGY